MSIYDTLNPIQRSAVEHDKGPLLILAGAGSGKTRVLTHRISYLIEERNVSPYQILAITFTNKAAKEMRERVNALISYGAENIWVSTFHSTCVRILRRYIDELGFERNFTIYDDSDQKSLMKGILKDLKIDTKQTNEKYFINQISSAKDELISPETFAKNSFDYSSKKVAEVYTEYQKRLKANNALDFDDIIFKTVELFMQSEKVLSYYQSRFSYIMVDEYQDTNTAQFRLIKLLASHTNDYGEVEHNLCVVGDDDQSIYKFRGANIYNILNFEKEYPSARVIKLEQNYRSTQNILNAANEVIHHNKGRKEKSLWTENDEGSPVHFTQYVNEIDEAEGVAANIERIMHEKGCAYKDFAVLYRTNAQSLSFEKILRAHKIKAKTIGALSFFQRKEVKDLISYLKAVDNPRDDMAVKRIINVPKRGIGATTIEKLDAYTNEFEISFFEALERVDVIPGLARSSAKITSFVAFLDGLKRKMNSGMSSIRELIDEILETTGYIDELRIDEPEKAEDRIGNIDALISFAERYQQNEEDTSLTGFLEYCGLNADTTGDEEISENDDDDDADNYVSLMTLHNAKGLEFPYVFLCGMEDGVFPGYMSIHADNPEVEIEEERRLCYVGITRAMKELYLSAAKLRMMHGETQMNSVSRFIHEIPRYLLTMDSSGDKYSFRNSDAFPKSPVRNAGFVSQKSSSVPGSSPYGGMFNKPAKNIGSGGLAPLSYNVGDSVRHVKFGIGIVTAINNAGKDYEVTVDFKAGGVKKLLSTFAKLEKI